MATPRLRQLRRDKLVFALAIRTIRLHLEEENLLAQQPELRQAPNADLLLLQQGIDQWVSMSAGYITRKFHCPLGMALQMIGEVQAQLRRSILPQELHQMSLAEALHLPPDLLTSEGEAEQPQASPTREV